MTIQTKNIRIWDSVHKALKIRAVKEELTFNELLTAMEKATKGIKLNEKKSN